MNVKITWLKFIEVVFGLWFALCAWLFFSSLFYGYGGGEGSGLFFVLFMIPALLVLASIVIITITTSARKTNIFDRVIFFLAVISFSVLFIFRFFR